MDKQKPNNKKLLGSQYSKWKERGKQGYRARSFLHLKSQEIKVGGVLKKKVD